VHILHIHHPQLPSLLFFCASEQDERSGSGRTGAVVLAGFRCTLLPACFTRLLLRAYASAPSPRLLLLAFAHHPACLPVLLRRGHGRMKDASGSVRAAWYFSRALHAGRRPICATPFFERACHSAVLGGARANLLAGVATASCRGWRASRGCAAARCASAIPHYSAAGGAGACAAALHLSPCLKNFAYGEPPSSAPSLCADTLHILLCWRLQASGVRRLAGGRGRRAAGWALVRAYLPARGGLDATCRHRRACRYPAKHLYFCGF